MLTGKVAGVAGFDRLMADMTAKMPGKAPCFKSEILMPS
jgi:hypothetical protein